MGLLGLFLRVQSASERIIAAEAANSWFIDEDPSLE